MTRELIRRSSLGKQIRGSVFQFSASNLRRRNVQWNIAKSLLTVLLGLLWMVYAPLAVAQSSVSFTCSPAKANQIVCENSFAGTPQSTWDIPTADAGDPTIQGYATDISFDQGATVSFKINTPATSYRIDIYRMGYYNNNGARLIYSMTHTGAENQPACTTNTTTALIDCGNWSVTDTWTIPSNATSGIYFAKLTRTDTGGCSHIVFVVRNDASTDQIVFKASDTTWQAYNDYGGANLYTGGPGPQGGAYMVSYNRPFHTRTYEFYSWVFNAEFPMIEFLEANGYDITYVASMDVYRNSSILNGHKLMLSLGHDEYWDGTERTNVENALAAGVNLAFFSGNEVFWKTRWTADSNGVANRVMVCYKETHFNAIADPDDPPTSTGTWRDPRFGPPQDPTADGYQPENGLTGTIYYVDGPGSGEEEIQVPYTYSALRFWRNTAITSLASGKTYTTAFYALGYEWDIDSDNGFRPTGLFDLSAATYTSPELFLLDYGSTYGAGTATHQMTTYKTTGSTPALVFASGTTQWAWGLNANHDGGVNTTDTNIQQATINLFADMGVQPATLITGLVAASASTDTVSPTSQITSPTSSSSLESGSLITISGTATDELGVVAGVAVSTDGGNTWHPATIASAAASTTWTYNWTPGTAGAFVLKSRAVDDSGNIESPTGSVNVTVNERACPCSIWNTSATPLTPDGGDGASIEVGVKFTSSVNGNITGIRFYKAAKNTGTHIGNLWSSTGTNLATGTFTGESASGWQTLTFANPVAITAGTVYVASYFAPAGHYSNDLEYFGTAAVVNTPLTALATTTSGGNGVYTYDTTSIFPTTTFQATNYWVDVILTTSGTTSSTGPSVVSVTPTSNATNVAVTTSVTASFSSALNAATVTGTTFTLAGPGSTAVPATVSYNSSTLTATLTPSASLANSTTYTATLVGGASGITDSSGNPMSTTFTWSFTTAAGASEPGTCPCSVWSSSTVPGTVDSEDPTAGNYGFRFMPTESGTITGIRFYKASTNTGTHIGNLWSNTGTLLGTVTFGGETSNGWQQANFTSPIAVNANTPYVASYYAPNGHYSADASYFTTTIVNTPLEALQDGLDGSNGVYLYSSSSAFPTSTFGSSNYWVDVVFVPTPANAPPTVSSVSPVASATNVAVTTSVSAVFSIPMTASSVNSTTFTLTGPGSTAVPATVTYNSTTQSATLLPSSALAYSTTYTATISGGSSGVTSSVGTPLAANYIWSFTTGTAATQTTNCPCSLWSASTFPGVIDSADPNGGEFGVRFQSTVSGTITGIRFYKASTNTGTHIGNLWTTSGTLLETVTFSGETASGWQQANFATGIPITANTTYVASYFAPAGHYSGDDDYFTSTYYNSPLLAPQDGLDGANGVYMYSASTTFPTTASGNGSNYWVDVVFVPNASTTAPTVTSVTPANGSTGVSLGTTVTALFSEPMTASSITGSSVLLQDSSGNSVAATVTYNAASASAVLTPTIELNPSTTYTATIVSGANGVADYSGNFLASNFSWSFTTGAAPAPSGPGGPILVITSTANPFTNYLGEILSAEGLNEYTLADISTVTASMLAGYDLAILGDMSLTASEASMLSTWVGSGGNLIAMHPDPQLAGVLGLTSTVSTLSNGYIAVNTSSGPGVGIVGTPIQFHGTASMFTLGSATSYATLYSNSSTATASPAVTLAKSGSGQAAAFTYDLARSVVYTRQGNPAWSGEPRDGQAGPIRPDNLFYGAASFDPEPDWVNLNNVAIPQADEQQRLLANLILQMEMTKKPLPRFWYFPSGYQAVVVLTGDDHGSFYGGGATVNRFNDDLAASPAGCSVANWTCVRATAYLFPNVIATNTLTTAQATSYVSQGFEISVHVDSETDCNNWTRPALQAQYSSYLSSLASEYPGLPAPATHRMHCVGWSDYDSQPIVELQNGIRLDTTYYYWPATWINNVPGMFTGSGMPMRFTDRYGNLINVYQATTQMTDESGQTYPQTIQTLLANALGSTGYYGAFVVNAHNDMIDYPGIAPDIISSAQAVGVPIISAQQLLTWLDGRNGSSFGSLSWTGSVLSFTVTQGNGANNIMGMLPINGPSGPLLSLTLAGAAVTYTTQTIKGVQYAMFSASPGTYQATYQVPTFSVSGTITGAGDNGATVTLTSGSTTVATTTSSSTGAYSFTKIANGSYTVTPTLSGYNFTPTNAAVTVNGANVTVPAFSSTLLTFTVSGTITGAGDSGATVTLTSGSTTVATTTSSSTGTYSFSNVANGSYTVTPTLTGFAFTPTNAAVTVNGANVTVAAFSSTAQAFTVSGTITGAGGNAATVTLTSGSTTVATTTASSSGAYSFTVGNGAYTVTPTNPGFAFTPISQAATVSGANVVVPAFSSTAVSLAIDQTVSHDATAASKTNATAAFSTTAANELLLAFVSADYISGASTTVTGITGGSLTWTLVARENAQDGDAEVWRAFSSTVLSNITVTATLSQSVYSSMTVVTFTGVNTSGTNGSGAIGATSTASAASGAPTASLTTTVNNSWVFGVGDDWDNDIARTLGTGQTMVHQDVATGPGDTYWVQRQTSTTPTAGTTVTINDTAPTTDRYNLAILEVLPGAAQTWTVSGTITGSGGNGATVTLTSGSTVVATTAANSSGAYTFTGIPNGSYTVTPANTGYTFTPANAAVTVSGANVTVPAFSSTQAFTVSGTITGAVVSGVTLTLTSGSTTVATTTSNSSGAYSFPSVANGSYTVTPTLSGYAFTPTNAAVTVNGANVTVPAFSSTLLTFTVSGTITGAGDSGATVTLTSGSTTVATTTSSSTGTYSFSSIANGSYTVTPTLTGFAFTPVNAAITVNGANVTVAAFSSAAAYTVSGTITGTGGNGATVTLTSGSTTVATTTANSSGAYSFTVVNGSYTVTPTNPGYTFAPGNQAATVSGANVVVPAFTATAASLAIDQTVSHDATAASKTNATAAFSTTAANELLLAFVSADYSSGTNTTVTGIAGGSLTWTLVARANGQDGTAEIWRAFSPTVLTSITVTATLSQSVYSSITVMTFTGVNTSGTNGSGAIGATNTASAASGAPTASLVTTVNNSWVIGVGDDWDNATARTVGPNQTIVHQDLAKVGDTYWVQRQNSTTPTAGTTVTINDTAPTTDRYNLAICEILP